jgi:uncharacterized protein (DUF2249 family)
MSDPITAAGGTPSELDVRAVPKPQRHPLIFERFASLPPLAAFVLINGHDPQHLRQEFERDHAGTYEWSYLESGPLWRILIRRLSSPDLPQVVGDTATFTNDAEPAVAVRQLDISPPSLNAYR